jgi:hypothetical protein
MDSKAQLIEAAKRIDKLIELAVAPARREAARLSTEAAPLKARREGLKARLAEARARASRLGWIPVLGGRCRAAEEEIAAEASRAEADWGRLRARARDASDVMAQARSARSSVACVEARARQGGDMSPGLGEKCGELLARVRFLAETEGRDAARADALAPKVFRLAVAAENIARAWDGKRLRPAPAAPAAAGGGAAGFNRPVEPTRKGKARQLSLDFDGTGQVEAEPRIWLPVSASRTRELVERGARIDRDAPRRGSQMWVPVSERGRVESLLPMAFRRQVQPFSFPPIRHNAVGQNLWSVFDRESWNHIRTTAYDRAGHRCMICGKQGGSLWGRIAPPDEIKRGGVVDCHEVWEWEVVDEASGVGIQRLKRLLVVCKDCHMLFHEGFALHKAREAGVEQEAADYIRTLRQLVNRCDGATLDAQLAADREEWERNKGVGTWVLDLSHLASQDYMSNQTLVLQADNRAGVGPGQIGGIAFAAEDGTVYAARDARELAEGGAPRQQAAPAAWGRP